MSEEEWLNGCNVAAMYDLVTGHGNARGIPALRTGVVLSERRIRLWVEACRLRFPESTGESYLDVPRQSGYWWSITAGPSTLREKSDILRDLVGNPFNPLVVVQSLLNAEDAARRGDNWLWAGCLTPTVVSLATVVSAVHDGTLDHDTLGVLADALEEAGCTSEWILKHLRGWRAYWTHGGISYTQHPTDEARHHRGCHVVEAILGRNP